MASRFRYDHDMASAAAKPETDRFRAKREGIVAAASAVINEQSAKGLTFADVARRVGLNTTSVTYYFKRKDDLAAACFERTLAVFAEIVAEAARAPDSRARIARFIELHFAQHEAQVRGEEPPLAGLSDLRAMDAPVQAPLMAMWRDVFRATRAMLDDPAAPDRDLATARGHVLLENAMWLNAWLRRYELDEYPRVRDRLIDVLCNGFAMPGAAWAPQIRAVGEPAETEPGRGSFLLAATRLINTLGYRGASVQRIASELNVTKGSFYHHLDAKDELVIACFKRSFATIAAAQRDSGGDGRDMWARLSSIVATLLDFQFSDRGPLLRTSALAALPPPRARGDDRAIERHRPALRRDAQRWHRGRFDPRSRSADRGTGDHGGTERGLRPNQMGRRTAP